MASEIEQAIRQICEEKGLSYEAVIETIEAALSAAYRKDYGNKMQNIESEFAPESGAVRVFDVKEVVEDLPEEEIEEMRRLQAEELAGEQAQQAAEKFGLKEEKKPYAKEVKEEKKEEVEGEESEEEDLGPTFNPKTEMMISDAKVLKFDAAIGDVVRTELPVAGEFGRMAAMTAKQVITQKLREAEREIVFNEYKEQEGEVLIGTVQRREGRVILVDIGRTVGIILPEDQISTERYNSGDRIKVHVREVTLGTRGPQIALSRTSDELVRILFEIEIPEVADGVVQIKNIAREAGARTKIAVHTTDESIDPIGACIGQRGIRIQTVISELGGEKIDVVEWSDDAETFIENSLSPAKVAQIDLNDATGEATITVERDQLSLAIGKGGQNVRLAAKLTEWKLNIEEDASTKVDEEKEEKKEEETVESEDAEVKTESVEAEEVMEDATAEDTAEKVTEEVKDVATEEESTEEVAVEEAPVEKE